MNGYNRIKRFFLNFTNDKRNVYETLDFLFNCKSTKNTNPELIEMMKENLGSDEKRFLDIKSQPHKYLKLFYKLQRYNDAFRLRNFALMPIMCDNTQGSHTLFLSVGKNAAPV